MTDPAYIDLCAQAALQISCPQYRITEEDEETDQLVKTTVNKFLAELKVYKKQVRSAKQKGRDRSRLKRQYKSCKRQIDKMLYERFSLFHKARAKKVQERATIAANHKAVIDVLNEYNRLCDKALEEEHAILQAMYEFEKTMYRIVDNAYQHTVHMISLC